MFFIHATHPPLEVYWCGIYLDVGPISPSSRSYIRLLHQVLVGNGLAHEEGCNILESYVSNK